MPTNILTSTSRVEVPYIWVIMGGYAFGTYSKSSAQVIDASGRYVKQFTATYPNFVQSLVVDKVGGSLNNYSLSLVYAVRPGEDPNKIDKIISSIANTRKITIAYGDLNTPNFSYKDEEALITSIETDVDTMSATIRYTIRAVSAATCLQAGNFSFPKRTAKPSSVIMELLGQASRGLQDVFPGMRNKSLVAQHNLIATDDRVVPIQAKTNITIFDYLKYLVSCMSCLTDAANSITKRHRYILTIQDDLTGTFGGPYFTVKKVATSMSEVNSLDMFEVDIGYPSANIVTDFSIQDNQSYALLYNYAARTQQSEYVYRVNDQGEQEAIYSPALSTSRRLYISTEADRNWWSQVTQYPISASLTLKGLLRPAMLMTYIKVNVLFNGQKHNSSGIYLITSQQDSVSAQGYRTSLGLVRIAGDSL